ncbi:MAG: (2Fe-2S)-binding protein [Bryobacterales bacterium]|nr:(2Fe-2S)-binding protein [Bryobacterales bacterium]
MLKLRHNGREIEATERTTVAAAVLGAGARIAGPLCAMGVCMGCRMTIDGRAHQLACQTLCREGMEVETP